MKMNEKEALEIAKKSDDEKELETLVDNMDLSKKVRLEVAKRKDSTAYYAKLALTDKMFTEDDILYMLIDDKNKKRKRTRIYRIMRTHARRWNQR